MNFRLIQLQSGEIHAFFPGDSDLINSLKRFDPYYPIHSLAILFMSAKILWECERKMNEQDPM